MAKFIKKIDVIFSSFRTIYARQLGSDNKVKRSSLEKALTLKCDDIYTRDVFLKDYAKRVDLLISSMHFQEACANKGLDAFSAATHVVLLGWQNLEDCLLREGYKSLVDYPEWREPLFTREELKDSNEHLSTVLDKAA